MGNSKKARLSAAVYLASANAFRYSAPRMKMLRDRKDGARKIFPSLEINHSSQQHLDRQFKASELSATGSTVCVLSSPW